MLTDFLINNALNLAYVALAIAEAVVIIVAVQL